MSDVGTNSVSKQDGGHGAIPVTNLVRIPAVDILFGIAILLLALDFTRDFLIHSNILPTDLRRTYPSLFLTRWITYFYAPLIIFLSGIYVYLRKSNGVPLAQLTRFLLIRGVLFIIIEVTLVSFSWSFNIHMPVYLHLVFVLGASMLVMSVLIHLPIWASLLFGIALIAGHDIFAVASSEYNANEGQFQMVIHGFGPTGIFGKTVFVLYPVVPWVGVMAIGYCAGVFYQQGQGARRRHLFLQMGLLLIALFVALRLINGYGDAEPWRPQSSALYTVFSFLNVNKFPPSLDFLLMTLGPGMLVLRALDGRSNRLLTAISQFGRVPLFFFVVLGFVLHMVAILVGTLQGFHASELMGPNWTFPVKYGLRLPAVYLVWLGVLLGMYPICRWYEDLRNNPRYPWLLYL
jgi:uncharacterized membrane protein